MKRFGWLLVIFSVVPLLFGCLSIVLLLVGHDPADGPRASYWQMFLCCLLPSILASGLSLFFGRQLIRSGTEKELVAMARFPPEKPILVRVPMDSLRYKMPAMCVSCGAPAHDLAHKALFRTDKYKVSLTTHYTNIYINLPLCLQCQKPTTGVEKKRIKGAVKLSTSEKSPHVRELIFTNEQFARQFDEVNKDRFERLDKDIFGFDQG